MSGCGQNMVQLARGSKVVLSTLTATTTSEYKESRGHNAFIVFLNIVGTGTWTITVQSRIPETNTFVDHYDSAGNLMAMTAITASRSQFFTGIPDDFKFVSTEVDGTASATIAYELLTV